MAREDLRPCRQGPPQLFCGRGAPAFAKDQDPPEQAQVGVGGPHGQAPVQVKGQPFFLAGFPKTQAEQEQQVAKIPFVPARQGQGFLQQGGALRRLAALQVLDPQAVKQKRIGWFFVQGPGNNADVSPALVFGLHLPVQVAEMMNQQRRAGQPSPAVVPFDRPGHLLVNGPFKTVGGPVAKQPHHLVRDRILPAAQVAADGHEVPFDAGGGKQRGQFFRPHRRQNFVGVQNKDPLAGGAGQGVVSGRREIFAPGEGKNPGAKPGGHVRRPVGGARIHHNDFLYQVPDAV